MAKKSLTVMCIHTLLVLVALKATECRIERLPSSNPNIKDDVTKGVLDVGGHNSTSDAVDKLTDSIVDMLDGGEGLDNRERHQNTKRSRRVEKTRGRISQERFDWTRSDFVVTDNLPDGENEKRIKLGKISAKETSVGKNGMGLVLRQLTDGRHFIQTISNMAGEMVDCEYIQDGGMVRKFLRDFRNEIKSNFNQISTRKLKEQVDYKDDEIEPNRNRDMDVLNDDLQENEAIYRDDFKLAFGKIRPKRGSQKKDFDDYYFDAEENWTKFDSDSRYEKKKHQKKRFPKLRYTGLRNVTVLRLRGRTELPEDIAEWLNLNTLEKRCDNVHEKLKQSLGLDGNEDLQMQDSNTLERTRTRNRRSILIAPGMLWCGAGQLARSPRELGELSAPDACCRAHDLCGGGVPGLGRKNGLLNYRPFTVSRCSCDRRFRACLKLANTDAANMVGKLFFNVVQTKCFVLKPAKACLQRSWWGKCLQIGYTKQAHLRENPGF